LIKNVKVKSFVCCFINKYHLQVLKFSLYTLERSSIFIGRTTFQKLKLYS